VGYLKAHDTMPGKKSSRGGFLIERKTVEVKETQEGERSHLPKKE